MHEQPWNDCGVLANSQAKSECTRRLTKPVTTGATPGRLTASSVIGHCVEKEPLGRDYGRAPDVSSRELFISQL
jgi:hypothetical protein